MSEEPERTEPSSERNGPSISRRRFFHWLIGLSSASALFSLLAASNSLKPLVVHQSGLGLAKGDKLAISGGNQSGDLLAQSLLPVDQATIALPQSQSKAGDRNNTVIAVHFKSGQLQKPTNLSWTSDNFAVYSAICTHMGCIVGHQLHGTQIVCPCHGSVYDLAKGATVVGGPAPRPLPQLAIGFDSSGDLQAEGSFTEPIGPVE